jgi:hypothetical protein
LQFKRWKALVFVTIAIFLMAPSTPARADYALTSHAGHDKAAAAAIAEPRDPAALKHLCQNASSSATPASCPRRGPIPPEVKAAVRNARKASATRPAATMAEADGMAAVATAPQIPDWCDIDEYYTNLRMNDCYIQLSYVSFYRIPDTGISGIATVTYFEWATMSPNSRTWDHHLAMYISDAFGDALTSTFTATPWCNTACRPTTSTTAAKLPTRKGQWYKGKWSLTSPGTATVYPEQDTDLYFTSTATPSRQIYDWTPIMGYARCDSSALIAGTPNGGCSYYKVAASHELSAQDWRYGKHAAFISQAQTQLPDRWGLTVPLTRMYDPVQETNNRTLGCDGFIPKNPMDTCDLYPFDGTRQGAASVGKARIAVGHVPADQRAAGEAAFATFVSSNRVLDGDTFWVGVDSPPVEG